MVEVTAHERVVDEAVHVVNGFTTVASVVDVILTPGAGTPEARAVARTILTD